MTACISARRRRLRGAQKSSPAGCNIHRLGLASAALLEFSPTDGGTASRSQTSFPTRRWRTAAGSRCRSPLPLQAGASNGRRPWQKAPFERTRRRAIWTAERTSSIGNTEQRRTRCRIEGLTCAAWRQRPADGVRRQAFRGHVLRTAGATGGGGTCLRIVQTGQCASLEAAGGQYDGEADGRLHRVRTP